METNLELRIRLAEVEVSLVAWKQRSNRGWIASDIASELIEDLGFTKRWGLSWFPRQCFSSNDVLFVSCDLDAPAPKGTHVHLVQHMTSDYDQLQYCERCCREYLGVYVSAPGGLYGLWSFPGVIVPDTDGMPSLICSECIRDDAVVLDTEVEDLSQVQTLFDLWVAGRTSMGLTAAVQLTPKRTALLKRVIKTHGYDKVELALLGWPKSSWHVTNQVNDLEIILRERNITKFGDLVDKHMVTNTQGVSW